MYDEIIGGVDTHAATHCAAVIDGHGRLLGTAEFAANHKAYGELVAWMAGFGRIGRVGVEGTGAYGAGLPRHLHAQEITVLEVPRPDRRLRRQSGKSDPIDAEAAARAVLAGTATVVPKGADGPSRPSEPCESHALGLTGAPDSGPPDHSTGPPHRRLTISGTSSSAQATMALSTSSVASVRSSVRYTSLTDSLASQGVDDLAHVVRLVLDES